MTLSRGSKYVRYKLGLILSLSVVAGGMPKISHSAQPDRMLTSRNDVPGNSSETSPMTSLRLLNKNGLQESIFLSRIQERSNERIGRVFKKQDGITPVVFSELDDSLMEYLVQKLKKIAEQQSGLHPSQFFVTDAEGNFGLGIPKEYATQHQNTESLLLGKGIEEKFLFFPDRKSTQKGLGNFFHPFDIFPEEAQYLLVNGNIYERGTSRSAGYIHRAGGGKKLTLTSGMGFRIIHPDWIAKYGTSFDGVEEMLGEIRKIQRERFTLLHTEEYFRAENRYAALTGNKIPNKNFFLDVISRIRPDMLTPGKPGILHPVYKKKAEKILGITLGENIEDNLLVLFSTFHTEVVKNGIVTDLIAELDASLEKNEFSRLEWDTELNTQAVLFIMLTQHNNFEFPQTNILPDGIENILELKLGRYPSKEEIEQAAQNFQILQILGAKRLLPENLPITPGSLLDLSDMLTYVGEMADFHGFAYERKKQAPVVAARNTSPVSLPKNTSLSDETRTKPRQTGFIDTLYSIFSSTAGYIETKSSTYCLARAVEGLRRGFNISIGRHGDSHEIISAGLTTYASKIREHLEKLGQIDRFLGYDTEFGKTRFTPPPGATGGIIFIDTRPYKRDGSRAKSKGHAAGFVVTPKGEVVVYDPYYQGKSNSPTRKLEEYLSENSGPKFWSFISQPENRVGAIFISGDPKKLLETYKNQ